MCERAYEIARERGEQYNTKDLDPIKAQGLLGIGVHVFEVGCRVFNMTKIKEKNSLTNSTGRLEKKLEDDFLDAINFAVFGLLLLHDKWKI